MCHSTMGLTRCYKTGVFTYIFAVFKSQSIAEILLLPLLESKRTPYRNSTFDFHFKLFIVIGIRFCTDIYPNWTISDSYDVM